VQTILKLNSSYLVMDKGDTLVWVSFLLNLEYIIPLRASDFLMHIRRN
jgi:hypothetical protein